MAAGVADIGRDDETDRGAEENREAQAEEKFSLITNGRAGPFPMPRTKTATPRGQGTHRPFTTPPVSPLCELDLIRLCALIKRSNDCVHSNGSVLLRVCGPKPRNR